MRCTQGATNVTVAEGNRAVLDAFHSEVIRNFTGNILSKVRVIDYEGRHFLAHTHERFDVIDLSLADSVGLSNPGGFAIVEKFTYTKEAMETYMRALAPGGVLSVTLWNKEEPPKSVLKLYATMAGAARDVDPSHLAKAFFVVSSYLSTATVLYENGGFTPDEIEKLRTHTRNMSFDEIYSPGFAFDPSPDRLRRLMATCSRFSQARPAVPRRRERAPATTRTRLPMKGAVFGPSVRKSRRWRPSRDGYGTTGLACPDFRPLAGDRVSICVQCARADQRRTLLRRLR